MALTFENAFGGPASNNRGGRNQQQNDRPAAKLWLNIGYKTTFINDEGQQEDRMITLPMGIPVDTMEPIRVSGSNQSFREFTAARNDLLAQIMKAAENLDPNGEVELALTIQLRRVAEEQAEVDPSSNRFVKQLSLVA